MGGAVDPPAGADDDPGADGGLGAPERPGTPGGDAGRPLWRQGSRAAVVALGVALVVQGLVQLARGDGGGAVDEPAAEALSITAGIGGWPLVAAAVAFVVLARPWRLLRRRR